MELWRVSRLHFDFAACFSCSSLLTMAIEQTICPLLKGLPFFDLSTVWLSRKPYTH
jgi:hypothetical protein